jgi:hypothetical protein
MIRQELLADGRLGCNPHSGAMPQALSSSALTDGGTGTFSDVHKVQWLKGMEAGFEPRSSD